MPLPLPRGGRLGLEATIWLPAEPTSAGEARRFVEDALSRSGQESLAWAAVLLTSEVVTNAILHARSATEVHLSAGPGSVTVEVTDDGEGIPDLDPKGEMAEAGRGLAMVGALAEEWGVVRTEAGNIVWFRLVTGAGGPRFPS
ncbi:MAG: ATP-binding protein [Acidimicrobiales bacterium]